MLHKNKLKFDIRLFFYHLPPYFILPTNNAQTKTLPHLFS